MRLTGGPSLLLDGGLGSMLIAAGLPAGAPPEGWVLDRPDAVAAVHRAYAEAGSDAVHTTTFGAHPMRLARFGLEARCAEIHREAVRLARLSGAPFVIGDIGPTGEFLPPVGRADPEAVAAGYRLQGRLLNEAGVDALHIETMTDLREAKVALAALCAFAPGLPILASLTFEGRPRGYFTIMGDPLVRALEDLAEAGASAVGANCTLASADMCKLALRAASAVLSPLVIQPNAGQPVITAGRVTYTQTPEEFAEAMAGLDGRVAALGGCCGTDPRFIRALRARLVRA